MEAISFYLEKFRSFVPPHASIKKAAADVVQRLLGENIPEESITVRNNTLFLSVHPTLKSELYIRKLEVLQEIETILIGNGAVKELR